MNPYLIVCIYHSPSIHPTPAGARLSLPACAARPVRPAAPRAQPPAAGGGRAAPAVLAAWHLAEPAQPGGGAGHEVLLAHAPARADSPHAASDQGQVHFSWKCAAGEWLASWVGGGLPSYHHAADARVV